MESATPIPFFSFTKQKDKVESNYDEFVSNIFVAARGTNQGIIPFDAMVELIRTFTKKDEMYFAQNLCYSSIFLLCLDNWKGDITMLGMPSCVLEERYILGYSRYAFKAAVLNLFQDDEIVYSPEAYVSQPLEWNHIRELEDSQAKLLYQSFFYLALIQPEEVKYYGSGVGTTYATEVFRAYLDEKQIKYSFVDPQAVKDIRTSVVVPDDQSLVDVYDGSVVSEAIKITSASIIKATTQVGIDATADTGNFFKTANKKDLYVAVAKPFHHERMYIPIKLCMDYIMGMTRSYTIQHCHCFDCKALYWLSEYYIDTSWFMSIFNTTVGHHTNHKWKQPALNKFVDEKQSNHSGLARFSTVHNTAAESRFRFISDYASGTIAEFGPGEKPYKGADGWSKVNAMPLINDLGICVTRTPKNYTTVIASMSAHHDPMAFIKFVSLIRPLKIIVCDEIRPDPGRWWNHKGHYDTVGMLLRLFKAANYDLVVREEVGSTVNICVTTSRTKLERFEDWDQSPVLKDVMSKFVRKSFTSDLPYYLIPLVIPPHVRGLNFNYDFGDGKGSVNVVRGKSPWLHRDGAGLGHNAINYGYIVKLEEDSY